MVEHLVNRKLDNKKIKGPLMLIQKTAYLRIKAICQNCRVTTPTLRLKNHVIRPFENTKMLDMNTNI